MYLNIMSYTSVFPVSTNVLLEGYRICPRKVLWVI